MVLTVQEEVARRIVAPPGDMSLLGLSVQFYGQAQIVARLKAGAFYPRPKVSSAVVRIVPHPETALVDAEVDLFFRLARAGFGQRRKQLRNALTSGTGRSKTEVDAAFSAAGVDPQRRAQTLALEEWVALTRAFNSTENE